MRLSIIALVAAGFTLSCGVQGPATAQSMNDPGSPCASVSGTVALAACLSEALTSVDADRVRLTAQVRAALDPDARTRFDGSETAWIAFRDAACEAEYALFNGGSAGPVAKTACTVAVTRDRVVQLHRIYDWKLN